MPSAETESARVSRNIKAIRTSDADPNALSAPTVPGTGRACATNVRILAPALAARARDAKS